MHKPSWERGRRAAWARCAGELEAVLGRHEMSEEATEELASLVEQWREWGTPDAPVAGP